MKQIDNNLTASISELRRDPIGLVRRAENMPVQILHDSKPAIVVMGVEFFDRLLERLGRLEHNG